MKIVSNVGGMHGIVKMMKQDICAKLKMLLSELQKSSFHWIIQTQESLAKTHEFVADIWLEKNCARLSKNLKSFV